MEAINHTESDKSTERDAGVMASKQITSENSYNYSSDIKVRAYKSPQGDVVKQISSSVLGQRAKYNNTKLPNISRQPHLETTSFSGAPPHIGEGYYIPKDDNLDGSRTYKHADTNINKRKMKKMSVPVISETSDIKFINPGQINAMHKFIDHTSAKAKTENISIQPKIKHRSPRINEIQSKNLPYNDSSELAKKLKMLESQLGQIDEEYDTLKVDNEELIEQNNYMKDINKKLFMKMRDNEEEYKDDFDSGKSFYLFTI
jgi:hypothetical protein